MDNSLEIYWKMFEICFIVIAIFHGLVDLAQGQLTIYKAETTTGQRCTIPFVYKGKIYHDCITEGSDSPWCYVDKEFKKWEYCKPHPKEYDGCQIRNPNVTLEDVEEILRVHNKFRSKLPALRMKKLEWNSELAQIAQKAADKCAHVHIDVTLCGDREPVGQNLFYSYNDDDYPGLLSWTDIIGHWSGEEKNYDIDTHSCLPGKLCGHFTAVATDYTNLVGCGRNFCYGELLGKKRYSIQYYCNYYEPGNVGGQKPFIKSTGEKCKDCHLFSQNERFRCDEDQLCETCDSTMKDCMGMVDLKKMEASGNICVDTDINCQVNINLCAALKMKGFVPPPILEYVKNCKKTCGTCT